MSFSVVSQHSSGPEPREEEEEKKTPYRIKKKLNVSYRKKIK
jgi:hypothetical protein